MNIPGHYYPEGKSKQEAAELIVSGSYCQLIIPGKVRPLTQASLGELKISRRIGNIPRRIEFPDGAVLESQDNDRIDRMLTESNGSSPSLIHRLESKLHWALLAIVLSTIFVFVFTKWGLPAISHGMAYALPVEAAQTVGKGTLAVLDKSFFDPTELDDETQARLRERFAGLVALSGREEYQFELLFRKMDNMPNAFALPSGAIVVTDGLVELADNNAQVTAILLHEIGHVVHRHSLQMALESAMIPVIVTLITGDAISAGDMIASVPIFLLESHYSRGFEMEADQYALDMMLEHGMNPDDLANILEKLGNHYHEDGEGREDSPDYLSSHPAIMERVQHARALGLTQ